MEKQTKSSPLLGVSPLSRRQFVTGTAAGGMLLGLNGYSNSVNAQTQQPIPVKTLSGTEFNLAIGHQTVNFTGRERLATAVNGGVPAPLLRWREGDRIKINVTNNLAHDSSIHWHGMILPTNMDGVPGLSYDGIKPGDTFRYEFDVKQNGTYWYHSHSGFQEQTGLYGAIVIEPKENDPVGYDSEHVILLSDWTDENPEAVYAKLKKMSHYYNFRERTAGDLSRDIREKGVAKTWRDRAMWNQMRMSDTDIADVTGYTYTFLMNGVTPDKGWTGLFKSGEKVRLRFINGSAMTLFDIRIPGLKMTVVAADGQHIEPVTVDEFRIGTAETYDVIVEPKSDNAYTLFAQSIDRTGYARGTLTPDVNLLAEIPAMDFAPTLAHSDMGMADHDMTNHDMNSHEDHSMPMQKPNAMDHSQHQMNHSSMLMLGKAGTGSNGEIIHLKSESGLQTDMRVEIPQSGLNDPGIGLRHHHHQFGRKVLTYGDIKNLTPTRDKREPEREIQIHLTGNMNRYLWSFDGIPYMEADPIQLKYGERVRIVLVNDTMMTHPIHLHGLWSELETGDAEYIPRKHTILVQPGSKISYLVTADAKGRWAYHCHLMFHMHGMMREVRVS